MNFALGVNIAAASELPDILERAGRLGFSGIELNFAAAAAEMEIAAMKANLASSGIHLVAISAGKDFGLAARLEAPIAIVDFTKFNGEKELAAGADIAAASHMMLALENRPPISDARLLWALLEKLGHPAIGICWNSYPSPSIALSPSSGTPGEGRGGGYAAAREEMVESRTGEQVPISPFSSPPSTISRSGPRSNPPPEYQGRKKPGDSSAIVIPMLNLKICHVRIPAEKSEPSVALLRRLQGIGYRDWITLDSRRINPPDMAISACLEQLRKATDPVLHRHKPHKTTAVAIKK